MIRQATSVVLGLVLGIVGTLGATSWLEGRRAHLGSDGNTIGVPIATREAGSSHTVQVAGLCIAGADHARITSVGAVDTIGRVTVTDFTLTGMQELGHREPGPLEDFIEDVDASRTGPQTRRLTTRCSDDGDFRALAVQITDPPDAQLPVFAGAFDVEYEIGGRTKHVTASTSVRFCAGDERDRELQGESSSDGSSLALADCPSD